MKQQTKKQKASKEKKISLEKSKHYNGKDLICTECGLSLSECQCYEGDYDRY